MRFIDLNDYLCRDNVWTRRLLGMESFQQKRTIRLIEEEYNTAVYGDRLNNYKDDLDTLKANVLFGTDKEITISIKDKIAAVPISLFLSIKRQNILKILDSYGGHEALCELGAGYGQNLLWLQTVSKSSLYGGEYSKNAIELGKLLGLDISYFNFYEPETYEFIRPGTSIITSHAVEQIPDAQIFIDSLKHIKNRLRFMIHFEPIFRDDRYGLIGMLRNKYTQLNDYNLNLLSCLNDDPEAEILYFEKDLFGRNPLNPSSILVWKFN